MIKNKRRKHWIIPIFIPHQGCEARCIYCNQWKITDAPISREDLLKVIQNGIRNTDSKEVEVAFYGGSFTALPLKMQRYYLSILAPFIKKGDIKEIRLSTRPETINEKNLIFLKNYGVNTIEIGVQALDDKVLAKANRIGRVKDVFLAHNLLKKRGFRIGWQLMLGLPGSSREMEKGWLNTILRNKPDFIRLYPTLVLKGTKLSEWYKKGLYSPMDIEETVEISAFLVRHLEKAGIKVIRIGLQDDPVLHKNFIAGPHHPALGDLVRGRAAIQLLIDRKGLINIKDTLSSIKHIIRSHDGFHMDYIASLIGIKKSELVELI